MSKIKTKTKICPECFNDFILGVYGQIYCCEIIGSEKELIEKKAIKNISERYIGINRFKVFKRDNFKCIYCGLSSIEDSIKLHVDHIKPISKDGTSNIDNLVTSCARCNLSKSNWYSKEIVNRVKKIVIKRNKKHNLS